jgi:hypothetical protein
MPIHLEDLDVASKIAGFHSVLIVPCNMCPAVTVAVNERKPFLRFFRSFLKSAPFEQYVKELRSRLEAQGTATTVFRSDMPHQWFACMWSSGRRAKLRKQARRHDAVVVLGCDTATETVRESVAATGCTVIEGMEVVGFMNAKLRFDWRGNVSFADCRLVPISTRGRGDEPVSTFRSRTPSC